MVLTRSPALMTKQLRHIITRDTIITTHIVFSIAAILDSFYIEDVGPYDRYYIFGLVTLFIIIGILRLTVFSSNNRTPILSLIAYQVIATPTVVYLTDIRSFWPFFWLIPIFLSSFYFGKRVVYATYTWLGLALISQLIIQQKYIKNKEDYLYVIAEFLIIGALGMIFRDTLEISKEDRELLINSLEKAEFEEGRLNSLIYSITDGVVAVDEGGVIVTHNPSVLSIIDTHKVIVDKKFSEVFHIETLAGGPLTVDSLFGSKGTHDARIRYANGETAILSLTVQPITRPHNQKHAGYVIVLRDITKQKGLEDERNAFISLMAHELRTPLAIAEGSASNAAIILDKNADIETAKAAVIDIQTELASLTKLTNDFSLIMDINTNLENIKKNDEVDLAEIRKKLTDEFTLPAYQKGILLHIAALPGTATKLTTNKEYLEHILRSLLDNAVKYTAEGSVELLIEEKGGKIVFTVSDTGTGISKADRPGIFKPFHQAEDFSTRSSGGLGIGLYISKRLSDLIGGELLFESTYGKGTTFTLSLAP